MLQRLHKNPNYGINNNRQEKDSWTTKKRSLGFNGMLEFTQVNSNSSVASPENHSKRTKQQQEEKELDDSFLLPTSILDQWKHEQEGKVTVEYERKIQKAHQWRKNIHNQVGYIAQHMTISSVCPNQFQYPDGNTACSCISWAVASEFLQHNSSTVTQMDWDTMMKKGIDTWKSRPDKLEMHLFMDRVATLPMNANSRMTKIEEVGGRLYASVSIKENGHYCLEDGFYHLNEQAKNYENFAIVYNSRTYTICILSNHFSWWLFDSHGLVSDQKSSLVEFDQLQDLISFIRLCPYGQKKSTDPTKTAQDRYVYSMCLYSHPNPNKRAQRIDVQAILRNI